MNDLESSDRTLNIPKEWEECVISGLESSNPQLIKMILSTFCEGDDNETLISGIKKGTDELRITSVRNKKAFEDFLVDFAEKRPDVSIRFNGVKMTEKKPGLRQRISSLLPGPIVK